ncbi:MAG TPA: hypothetical protein EYP46_00940 [Hadesarchaea archaeon]|nr:hypothetical protein [Hadesarchaea archaeon]
MKVKIFFSILISLEKLYYIKCQNYQLRGGSRQIRLNLSPRRRESRGKTQRGWGMPWIRRLEVCVEAEWPEKDLTRKSAVG